MAARALKGALSKMAVRDPQSLFTYDLSTIKCAEQTILQMMPQLEQECQNPHVKQFFSDVAGKVRQHITRIEECFRLLGDQPMTVSCHVAEGFRREHEEFMQQGPSKDAIDLHHIGLATEMAHYMVGFYRILLDGALGLGHYQCQSILEDTLSDMELTLQQTEERGDRIYASLQGQSIY